MKVKRILSSPAEPSAPPAPSPPPSSAPPVVVPPTDFDLLRVDHSVEPSLELRSPVQTRQAFSVLKSAKVLEAQIWNCEPDCV